MPVAFALDASGNGRASPANGRLGVLLEGDRECVPVGGAEVLSLDQEGAAGAGPIFDSGSRGAV